MIVWQLSQPFSPSAPTGTGVFSGGITRFISPADAALPTGQHRVYWNIQKYTGNVQEYTGIYKNLLKYTKNRLEHK